MAVWKARVTQRTPVDAAGAFEVVYEILVDGVVTYQNLTTRGNDRDQVRTQIQANGAALKRAAAEAERIAVGDEVNIP